MNRVEKALFLLEWVEDLVDTECIDGKYNDQLRRARHKLRDATLELQLVNKP